MKETFLYQVNLTRDCNIRCTHCYIHSDTKRKSETMSEDRFVAVVQQIVDHMNATNGYQHAEIHVIGGEPTTLGRQYFERTLPLIRAALSGCRTASSLRLVTNLLAEDSVAIAQMFDLVSTSYEVGTRFSKQALEDRWVARVRQLQAVGMSVAVTTAMTRPVIEFGAAALLEQFLGLGIKQIHLGFFVPSGDGLVNAALLAPRNEETARFLIDAAEWYLSRRESYPDMYVNPIESMLAAIDVGRPIDDIVCPIISGSVDIDWDGNACSCLQKGGNENAEWAGNVFEMPISKLVETIPFRREVVRATAPRRPCRGCNEYKVCMSGCGVLHDHWSGEGECPGYKSFIKHLRKRHAEGVVSRAQASGAAAYATAQFHPVRQ